MNELLAQIVATTVLVVGAFTGAWFYRGHVDSLENVAAIAKVQKQADKDTADLRQIAANTHDSLHQQLEDSDENYRRALDEARRQAAAIPRCPVPVAAVGVLVTGNQMPQTGSTGSAGGTATTGGTVEAADVIASCEENRAIFERNRIRLDACRQFYEAVKKRYSQ